MALFISKGLALYGANSKVVKLTQANFKEKVMNSQVPWIVEFYAPWCGHCKSMAPAFEKAAKALEGMVNVGAVDMTTDQSVGSPYGVQGFPTIKLFGANKSSPKDHNGQRDEKAFVSAGVQLVRETADFRLNGGKSSSGSSSGSSGNAGGAGGSGGSGAQELNPSTHKTKGNGSWLIMYYAPWCPHCKTAMAPLNKAANNLKGQVNIGKVDCTVHQSLCSGVEGYPTLRFYDNNGKMTPYNGNRDEAGFINFSRQMTGMGEAANPTLKDLPVSQLVNQKKFDEYCVESKSSVCILAFLPHILDVTPEQRADNLKILEEVNKKNSGKPFNFLWSQGGDQFDFEDDMNLGMGYPTIVAMVANKKKFAVMRRSWSAENLTSFINALASNREHFYDIRELPKKLKTIEAYKPEANQKFEKDL